MNTEQLHELATNATSDHWPPHLGVRTDAEKIQYLADRLREATAYSDTIEDLNDQVGALQEENDDLQSRLDRANDIITKVRNAIA